MQALDWNQILEAIQTKATAAKARAQIEKLGPKSTPEIALSYQESIFATHDLLSQSNIRPFFESLDYMDPWLYRLKKGAVLKPIELKDVRHFGLEGLAFMQILESHEPHSPFMLHKKQELWDTQPLVQYLDSLITANGEIRSDASETLYRLFREKDQLAKQIQNTLDRVVKDFDMHDYLQEKFVTTREGRWVIPVKSGRQHSVRGVIHGHSQTKQTVYLEPDAIIPLNNRLRQVEVEIEEEIEHLLQQAAAYLFQNAEDLIRNGQALLEMDILYALAQFSQAIEAGPFQFSDQEISLDNLCHPLMLLHKKNPVPNNVQLNPGRSILLLSGPNAGGKTVLMKSIGLACHMARCGLPVAASKAALPFFNSILVGIGDSQQVDAELSTFAAHLKLLDQASQLKGPEHLVLIDEIASSTDPEEGSALAKSFIEHFVQNKVYAVITSHLTPLKSGWEDFPQVLPGSLEFDLKANQPTYQFLPGVAGQSLALEMAKHLHIQTSIIDRAYTLLSPASRARLEALQHNEQIKSDLLALQENLRQMRKELEKQKEGYHQKLQAFEKEKEQVIEKLVKEGNRKIEQSLLELRAAEAMDRHRKSQAIKQELPELIKASALTAPCARSSLGPLPVQNKEDFKKLNPPGTVVFVPAMKREGLVQSEPNARGEVMILVDSMRLQLPWNEVERVTAMKNQTTHLARQRGVTQVVLEEDPQLDVRGFTVAEALAKLEDMMDRSLQARRSRLRLIHGQGTEALKKALRAHLTRSPLVRRWSAARPEEGGDGATWIDLDLES